MVCNRISSMSSLHPSASVPLLISLAFVLCLLVGWLAGWRSSRIVCCCCCFCYRSWRDDRFISPPRRKLMPPPSERSIICSHTCVVYSLYPRRCLHVLLGLNLIHPSHVVTRRVVSLYIPFGCLCITAQHCYPTLPSLCIAAVPASSTLCLFVCLFVRIDTI